MFYAQIDSNRRAFAIQQSTAPVLGANVIEIPAFDQSYIGKINDQATGEWHAPTPQPQPEAELRRVSVLAFRRRFTRAERGAIEWAAVDRADQPEALRMLAAELRATLADQAAATYIDLADADTIEGVQGLEAMGLIATGRAAEIIGAAIEPGELP